MTASWPPGTTTTVTWGGGNSGPLVEFGLEERDKRDVDAAGKRGNVHGRHCIVYCWFAKLNNKLLYLILNYNHHCTIYPLHGAKSCVRWPNYDDSIHVDTPDTPQPQSPLPQHVEDLGCQCFAKFYCAWQDIV